MSAYICNNDHIKALAIFAASRRPGRGGSRFVDPRYLQHQPIEPVLAQGFCTWDDMQLLTDRDLAQVYADILQAENVRSVNYRYSDHEPQGAEPVVVTVRDFTYLFGLPAVHLLKMVAGLEYQSCECPDFEQSAAYELIQRIRVAAIQALPGYDSAPWEFVRPQRKTA